MTNRRAVMDIALTYRWAAAYGLAMLYIGFVVGISR